MNLLLVLPLTASTLPAAQSLLTRMYAWEPLRNNSILIVRDFPLTEEQCKPVLKVAEEIFSGGRASGEVIRTPMILPDPSYPYTYNFLFETAIKHIASRRKCPFLWLDPHCVPVRKGWIQTLEAEYQACGKPFLGHILTPARHNTPYPIMAAPAVYPAQMPKVILQRLISKRQTAWELSCADVIVQNAFASKLIHSIPNNGKPMIFTRGTHPGTVDINTIPSDALLVHTTGYKSLIAAYAGETQALPQAPVVKVAKEKPVGYYHSGNLGDIIYGLYAIKKAGGGKLYLGPKQLRTSPARSPIKQADYDRMAPLLSAQSYITSHAFSPRHPGTDNAFDMNIYRNKWDDREFRERAHISTLIQMQCHVLGVEEKFRQDEAWLTVPKPIQTGMFVCHRSERYRDKEFPWPKILEALKGRLLFIGLNSEHTQFCDEMDTTIPFWKCGDFLDMASVIAGSLGFIGNQSFPMSLALALNKPVIQEAWPNSPDCKFVRTNFLSQPLTAPQLDAWINQAIPSVQKRATRSRRHVMPNDPITAQSVSGVTVVITNFQRADMLWEAYLSCKLAKVANLVISSSAVTPAVQTTLERIKRDKPDVVISARTEDDGCNQAWLRGARAVKTDRMTILHDDDMLTPDYEAVVAGKYKADVVHWDGVKHGPQGVIPGNYVTRSDIPEGVHPIKYLLPFLLNNDAYTLSPVCGCYPTEHVIRTLEECQANFGSWAYLRPTMMVGNDLLLWLRACERYRTVHYTHKPLNSYGHWDGSASFDDASNNRMKLLPIYRATRRYWIDSVPRIIHCVPRYMPKNPDTQARIRDAILTWEIGYSYEMVEPCHQWTWARDSTSIHEPKRTPFLREVLKRGLDQVTDDSDIVALTNDDTITTSFLWFAAWHRLEERGACCSFRRNVPNLRYVNPWEYHGKQVGTFHIGRDAFFFTPAWLRRHLHEIPDYVMGFGDWDSTLAMLIRLTMGDKPKPEDLTVENPVSEIPHGMVFHAEHDADWHKSAKQVGNQYNRSLTQQFFKTRLGYPMPAIPGGI